MKKSKSTENIVEYCSYCGKKLIKQDPIAADNFGFLYFRVRHPYDKETGKLRMRNWVSCPSRNSFWTKFLDKEYLHDAHAIGEEYLI